MWPSWQPHQAKKSNPQCHKTHDTVVLNSDYNIKVIQIKFAAVMAISGKTWKMGALRSICSLQRPYYALCVSNFFFITQQRVVRKDQYKIIWCPAHNINFSSKQNFTMAKYGQVTHGPHGGHLVVLSLDQNYYKPNHTTSFLSERPK